MGLETMNLISDFVVTNPTASDGKSQGDDHFRGMKYAIKYTFGGITGVVTSTHTELNKLTGATVSTAELNKLTGATVLTADLNKLTGGTFSGAELNYLTGVTSAIQTQINSLSTLKANLAGATYTGAHDFSGGTTTVATGTLGGHAVNLTQLTATAFAAALPATGRAAGRTLITNGATDAWSDPAFVDNLFRITGSADATKKGAFEIDTNVTTGTTVTYTFGGTSGTIATTADITAAIAALSIGDHCISVHTGNGYGSVNTKIRRFTTILTSTGTEITYTDSATAGGSFTIVTTGFYSIYYQDVAPSSDYGVGISVNSTQLTTSIASIAVADQLACQQNNSTNTPIMAVSVTVRLTAGDVVRAHNAGASGAAGNATRFTIRKVGK